MKFELPGIKRKMARKNFIEEYLDYYADTEVPTIFDRWCCISGIGSILERNSYILHGHEKIYPNQYILIVGDSGSRKDTAIRRIQKLVKKVGYKTIAADKTSKEKLLMDMEAGLDKIGTVDYELDVTNLSKTKLSKNPTFTVLFPEYELNSDPTQCYIIAGEWNAFFGHSNVDFIDLLTKLWDYDDIYLGRIKTGKSVRVPYPTINILGGNTTVGIAQSFPTEVIGQGFFSRLLLVHAEPSGKRITWPKSKPDSEHELLANKFMEIKKLQGEFKLDGKAKEALDDIYQGWKDIKDVRFKSYSTRRFTHLLKLCHIIAASFYTTTIDYECVLYANTILHYTENTMPRALGEFGKAKNSDVSATVLELIEKAEEPLDLMHDIWPHVRTNLENIKQLGEIIKNLSVAGKVGTINGKLFPKKTIAKFDVIHCDVKLLREYNSTQET